jgi:hypothetical protein
MNSVAWFERLATDRLRDAASAAGSPPRKKVIDGTTRLSHIHRTAGGSRSGLWDAHSMTSKADRRAISRAVAKAIAYHDCGKPEKAAAWAAEAVRLLEAQAILTPTALVSRPE